MAVCKAATHNIGGIGWFDKYISSPQMIAIAEPQARPYVAAQELKTRQRSEFVHEFMMPLQSYTALKKADKRLVGRALEYMDAIAQEPDAKDTYSFKVQGTRPNGAPLDLVGSNEGDVIVLNKDAAKAFNDIRKSLNSFYDNWIAGIKKREGFDPFMPTEQIPDETIRERIREMEQQRRPGYIPRSRVGEVGFNVTFPDGRRHFYVATPQGADRIKIGKSRVNAAVAEASRIKESLKKKYKLDESAFGAVHSMEADQVIAEVARGDISSVEGLMELMLSPHGMKSLRITDADGKVVSPIKALFDKMELAKRQSGFQKHSTHRKDIPGYIHAGSFDSYFESSIPAYLMRGADVLAGLHNERAIHEAINDLRTAPKDADGKVMKDATGQPLKSNNIAIANWAQEHDNALSDPMSLSWMKNVAYHWGLGGSISAAAINFTQNIHTTFPYLTMMSSNPLKAASLMGRSLKDVTRLFDSSLLTSINPDKIFDATKAQKILSKDEAAFVEKLFRNGIFSPLMTEELANHSGRVHYGATYDKFSPYLKKAAALSTMMFSTVEQSNRIVAGLSAYRLYKSDPKAFERGAKWLKENSVYSSQPPTAELMAQLAVSDTQFDITKENRAKFMAGNMSSVAFQFQQYSMGMFELIRKAVRFSDAKMKTTMLGLMTTGLMATAGVWGLPFATPLKKIIEGVSGAAAPILGTNPLSLESPMREVGLEIGRLMGSDDPARISEYFTKGLARAAGIDISKRTSLDILPLDMLNGDSMEMAGPFAGLVVGGAVQAYQLYNDGYPTLAMAALMPVAIRNLAAASSSWVNDTNAEGFVSPSTGRTQIPAGTATPGEVALKAIGITPSRFAHLREEAEQMKADPAKLSRLGWEKSLAQRQVSSLLARTPESKKYWQDQFQEGIARVIALDEAQTDPRQRIMLDPDQFIEGVISRVMRDLEGPTGPEAAKKFGNKTLQALNQERMKEYRVND